MTLFLLIAMQRYGFFLIRASVCEVFFVTLCIKCEKTAMNKEKYVPIDNLELQFRSIKDDRGGLTFAEEVDDIPFPIKRIFWITKVPKGAKRGGHAHMTCKEVVCCVNGSFRLIIDNGRENREFVLDNPEYAVIIPEGVWCSLEDFSQDAVVMVAASEHYSIEGYIRDYDEYTSVYGFENNQE